MTDDEATFGLPIAGDEAAQVQGTGLAFVGPLPQGSSATGGLTGVAARGAAVTISVQLGRIVLQFGSVVVLARLLAPSAFGLIAMVTAVIGVADLVRDFGLSLAAIQAKHVSTAERTNLFWANTGLGAVCATAAVAATPLIAAVYREPRLMPIVPSLGVVFVLSGMATQYRADLARNLHFAAVALADLVGPAAGIVAAVALAVAGADYWALVAQQIVTAVAALTFVVSAGRWFPGRYRRGVSIRRFFHFGGGVLGTQLLSYVTRNVDQLAIGALWGTHALGLYSRAFQLTMVPINQINAPLTNVAVPVLARVHEDPVRLAAALRRAQTVACYITAPVLAVAGALADPLVRIVLGPQWTAVAPIFALLAFGGVFRSIAQIAYWAFLAVGRTSELLRLQLWTQPLTIVVVLAGVPWGGRGVAAGWLVANVGYWCASVPAAARAAGVPRSTLFRSSVRAVLAVAVPAGAAAAAVARLTQHSGPWAAATLGLAAAAAVIATAAVAIAPVRRDVVAMRLLALAVLRRR